MTQAGSAAFRLRRGSGSPPKLPSEGGKASTTHQVLEKVMTCNYPQRIRDELARHGLNPLPNTPPGQLRDAVRDLYRYEIKRLRASLLAGRIQKRDYADHVVELRKKYPILSLPTELWIETPVLENATSDPGDEGQQI